MAQVLVRNLRPEAVNRLKRKAKRHNRSLQEELKTILEAAAEVSDDSLWAGLSALTAVLALLAARTLEPHRADRRTATLGRSGVRGERAGRASGLATRSLRPDRSVRSRTPRPCPRRQGPAAAARRAK